jgi:zinc protease
VRTQWLNDWEQGFTDPERVGVALTEAIGTATGAVLPARDRMRQLTLADVQRVAAQRLVPDNRTVGTYLPTDAPRRAPARQLVDVAPMVQGYKGDAAVAQAEAFDPTPANLDARTGQHPARRPEGGAAAQGHARRHGAGPAGAALRRREQPARPGHGGGLDRRPDRQGRRRHDPRQQISDAFDKLQAEVGFGASGQTLTANITTVRQHLPAVMELVGKLLRDPAFPADRWTSAAASWLAGVSRAAQRARCGGQQCCCSATATPTRAVTCATPPASTRR